MTMTRQIEALTELQKSPQWVCYNANKKPINPFTGYGADCNDPSTWGTYAEALRACAQIPEAIGVGREFLATEGLTGTDLDHCIDEQGKLSDFAQSVIKRLNSYTEISPSGHGIHIWTYGSIPDNITADIKADGETRLEMYDHERYFTVTGNHVSGTPTTIEHRQRELLALHKETINRRRDTLKKAQSQAATPPPVRRTPSTSGDTPYGLAALEKECATLRCTQEGGRNAQMYKSVVAMGNLVGGNELTYATAENALYDAAMATGLPERELKEIPRMLQEGMQKPRSAPITQPLQTAPTPTISKPTQVPDEPLEQEETTPARHTFHCTDLGNAERFALKYGHKARWCLPWNCWMIFNGRCWEKDKTGKVDQFAKVVVRSIYREAANEPDDAKRSALAKHARSSESNGSIRAMLERAKSELPVTPDEFNQQLDLLNCHNGTLNLRTGELRPQVATDMLTRCLKVSYNPLALCPLWLNFVNTIFADDSELIAFVQESLGMSLSGNIKEQCWFLCHGEGNNGKSTLIEAVGKILADYALAANIKSFQATKDDRARYDVAEFYGKRLITASENRAGSQLDDGFIKKITSGLEPLRAEKKFESEFQFMPECTIWFSVNHKPVVKDTSKGMWRRVRYIPFTVTIPDAQIDRELPEKLMSEAEGILAWLVVGCMSWYAKGRLTVPSVVTEATEAYQNEQDTIARFLSDECVFSTKGKAFTSDLNARYELWCENQPEKPDLKLLKAELNKRNLHSKRVTGGKYGYVGIELKPLDSERTSEGSEGTSQESENVLTDSTSQSSMDDSQYYTMDSERSEVKYPFDLTRENKNKIEGVNQFTTFTTFTIEGETSVTDKLNKLKAFYSESGNVMYNGTYILKSAYFAMIEEWLASAERDAAIAYLTMKTEGL